MQRNNKRGVQYMITFLNNIVGSKCKKHGQNKDMRNNEPDESSLKCGF